MCSYDVWFDFIGKKDKAGYLKICVNKKQKIYRVIEYFDRNQFILPLNINKEVV